MHVRSRLLDFLLELRDKIGEGATDENIKAKSSSFDAKDLFNHAIFGAHTTIVVGNQNTQAVSFSSESIGDLQRFLQQLGSELSQFNLPEQAREQAASQVATIETELAAPRPNIGIIKTAGNILYGILLGVGGNLATDLLKYLTRF